MLPEPTQPVADASLPSLGVVIPTMNCRHWLPIFLDSLLPWLHFAAEVVVVDSFSTDGTLEYLKENLSHPRVTYISHPPGIYASWNHGVAQIQTPLVYFATVADFITLDGLKTLLHAANAFACDIVISKPSVRNRDGQPIREWVWPIDDIVATLEITAPRKLAKLEAVLFTAIHATGAMLGSSASNIYRTEVLKRFPFPASFGGAGDGAWGLQHAAEVSWAVVPGRFSNFLVHSSGGSAAERKSLREAPRADQVLHTAMASWRRSGVISDAEFARLQWPDLMASVTSFLEAKRAFDLDRSRRFPWILNPRAWRNRFAREHATRRLQQIKRQVLANLPSS